MKLSIVTTLYKSAPYVAEFHRRASAAARKITDEYEIVMVDDGSPDDSLAIAIGLAEQDARLRVVELSRNFGHHKALMTGMDHAEGDLVFLIDSDLEEQPELLEQFYQELQGGEWDVVYGYQARRSDRGVEGIAARLAWYFIRSLWSVEIPSNLCTMRLMRRNYVKALLLHRERNTVIAGLWVITGYKQHGLPIEKLRRDDTSYTLASRMAAFVEGITSFSTAPLRFMVFIGMLVSAAAFIFGIFVIFQKFIYGTAFGWASVMVSVWFIGGVMIFCMGIIGTYISRIFIETKNRPYTIIRKIYAKEKR
ncbi:MAG: glycosyltransferase family 2 protein [Alphaproteobacteria bacterium]